MVGIKYNLKIGDRIIKNNNNFLLNNALLCKKDCLFTYNNKTYIENKLNKLLCI